MRLRASLALLLLLSACATSAPHRNEAAARSPRLANLQRAAELPWKDEGRCVVRESSQPWPTLVERCFHALDHDRVRFNDPTGRCTLASAGAAAMGIGVCILAAPELAVGAVVVAGAVVVGLAIQESLDAYERNASREHGRPKTLARPSSEQEPMANPEPTPRDLGRDWLPPTSSDSTEHPPECRPIPVPHLGGDEAHNECADKFPPNRFPGHDVLVGGKHFDALQVGVRVLWEIKTDRFDTYSLFLRNRVADEQVKEMREERAIATACGYGFVVGVSSAAHKAALQQRAPQLKIVVTGCTR